MEMSQPFHDEKLRRIKLQQDAYEAILQPTAAAAEWESKLHPPILNHAIETAMTMLQDDEVAFSVTPMPKFYDAKSWGTAQEGAEAHERLFKRQMVADRFDEFQRPFILQAAINRVSIAKTYWREDKRDVKELQSKPMIPGIGKLSPVRLREVTVKNKEFFNGPVTETVDLRDFYWHEAATSLDNSRFCAHAIWMSPADILALAKAGEYDQAAADEVANSVQGSGQQVPQGGEIELEREKRSRKNGLVEVLELYDRDTMQMFVLGARKVLLKRGDWPFWHQQYPFTAMSLAPFPFSIQGLSLVEKLSDMQEAYWDLLNQTRDNTKLINNAIILLAADFDDPDSFEFAPGAVNTVDRPDQVKMWQPEYQLAQAAQPLMQMLQGDMQNLAMGQPLSIPLSGRVTATEIATLSQIAQNAAKKMKNQVTYAYRRIGYQRLRLNQQFIRTPQYIHDLGLDSDQQTAEILPQLLTGDYEFDLKPSADSDIRAERRAEAQALMTMAAQVAPVMAVTKNPLNMRAFMDKVLDAFGEDNTDEFYSAVPQTPPQLPGGQGGAAATPEGQAGVTSEHATSPTTSPSNAQSLAGGVAMARSMAERGGLMGNTVAIGGQ